MSDDLKPCPFCGEAKRLTTEFNGTSRYHVLCCKCGAKGPRHIASRHSEAAWNRRAAEKEVTR